MKTKKWTGIIGPWSWKDVNINGKKMHQYTGDACTWSVFTDKPNAMFIFTIYKGFVTDGASTPKPFRCILDDWYGDERDRVAVGHDMMYAFAGKCVGDCNVSRKEADTMLAGGAHKVIGKNYLHCTLIETAVQIAAGGDEHWGNMEKENETESGGYLFSIESVNLDK